MVQLAQETIYGAGLLVGDKGTPNNTLNFPHHQQQPFSPTHSQSISAISINSTRWPDQSP